METRRRLWTLAACLVVPVQTACSDSGAAPDEPVDLSWRLGAGAVVTYEIEYEQEMSIQMPDHAADGGRELLARLMLTGGEVAEGGYAVTARLDTLGAAMISGPGRQRFDTRNLLGDEFELSVGGLGGAARYGDAVPILEFGAMAGGGFPVSSLLDYAFVRLPDGPVAVGDVWSHTASRTQIEGFIAATGELTTEYRLVGWEEVDGVECARIEAEVTGPLASQPGDPHDTGMGFGYRGSMSGTATIWFDPASGTVVRLTMQESSEGAAISESVEAPILQRTTVQVRRVSRGSDG